MRKLDVSAVTSSIGLPVKSGTLTHVQLAYMEALGEIAKAVTGAAYDPTLVYILNGCVNTGSGSNYIISAGSVFFNGEVYLVDAASFTISGPNVAVGVRAQTFFTAANADPVQFTDGATRTIHQIWKIVAQAGLSGSGAGNFLNWVQLNLNIPTVNITGTGIANVTGAYPNKNIDVVIPNRVLRVASFTVGAVGVSGTVLDGNVCSLYSVTFPSIGTTSYQVLGTLIGLQVTSAGEESDASCTWTVIGSTRSATGFSIVVKKKDSASGTTNINFEYTLLALV